MQLFAIADPHLAQGTAEKSMEKFGPQWAGHPRPMAAAWRERVTDDDLVLIAGDISWAIRLEAALPDLDFLAALPGTKVMIKGNHDYWWNSISKVRAALPNRFFAVQGDAVLVNGIVVCGTRLWDVPDVSFSDLIDWREDHEDSKPAEPTDEEVAQVALQNERIYRREVARLDRSLRQASQLRDASRATTIVAMTHYPPCAADLEANELTDLFERHAVDHVVFGHLHGLLPGVRPFGRRAGVSYHLTSCDFLDFQPLPIMTLS